MNLYFTDKKSCNDTGETKMDGPVMFKDDTSILGTRDSLLGMFIGLLGLIIIAVTTFYVVRKIRRRNRLERIRRYLGYVSLFIESLNHLLDKPMFNSPEKKGTCQTF